MNYTHNITRKGQITIPKEFREKLGLDKIGRATLKLTKNGEIVLTPPKTIDEVRAILREPSFKDAPSEREEIIGKYLAKKHGVN